MKKKTSKLALFHETVRTLGRLELARLHGGDAINKHQTAAGSACSAGLAREFLPETK